MAMPRRADRDSRRKIEEPVAIDIFNHRPIAALHRQGINASVRRRRVLLVGRNELARPRTGQLGPNPGHLQSFGSQGHGSSTVWLEHTKEILRHGAFGASAIEADFAMRFGYNGFMIVSKRYTGEPIMVAQVTEQGVLVPKGL